MSGRASPILQSRRRIFERIAVKAEFTVIGHVFGTAVQIEPKNSLS
ncbi:Mycobacterium numidiamassiliense ORFan [Mycobacterium numidiamassiliense]|uniref:Mycobacterium numidiamassiliense ORFan n=1 Tax=Mycobacterium numidiamassiliense TaxID=1841861 RepID=A0A2U3PHU1_9MYCO|nr:Mycobacterium numidiamassiliense ORFan [Mycobacterium numidiamassiliense]